jgi:hypothetical protein
MLCFEDLRRASEAALRREVAQIENVPRRSMGHEEALLA